MNHPLIVHWDSTLKTDTTKVRRLSRKLIDLQLLLPVMSLKKYEAL